MHRLLHDVFHTTRRNRAPRPLHVGRLRRLCATRPETIQGRRVGEWLGKHRWACARRDRKDGLPRRCADSCRPGGARRSGNAPGSSNAEGRHALNVEIRVRILVPDPGRVAQTAERLSYTQEAAGSIPASLTSSRRRRSRNGRDMKEGSGSAAAFRSHARRRRSRKGRGMVEQVHVAVAQRVERPSETRGAAGSIPAGHIEAP